MEKMKSVKNGKKTWLAVALIPLVVASVIICFLAYHKSKVQARENALSDLCLQNSLIVGNDSIKVNLAEVEANGDSYTLTQDSSETIKITDMKQAIVRLPDAAGNALINVFKGDKKVFSGDPEQFASFFPENGSYRIEVQCPVNIETVTEKGEKLIGNAVEHFIAELEYAIPMDISFQSDHIKEGSVITVTGSGVRGDVIISAGEVLAPFHLVTDERGYAKGLFSVSYITPPGTYTAVIESDEGTEEFNFTIEEEQYTVQHLTISEETQSSTIGSSENRDAYNEMIDKTYYSWYPERFYDDCFTQPVEGAVTTEFGLFRYTNDNPVPTRHAGVDIANAEGTPVLASASGYVIAAGYNGVSGNTVVMDHGFGVRTYYFHMSELCVEEGAFIEEGTEIGKVGETGYANGPHLHFNLMVHDNSVDPWAAFDGTSGIFSLN